MEYTIDELRIIATALERAGMTELKEKTDAIIYGISPPPNDPSWDTKQSTDAV